MAAHAKKAQLLARQLFKLSLVDGVLSAERATGVLVIRSGRQERITAKTVIISAGATRARRNRRRVLDRPKIFEKRIGFIVWVLFGD